MPVLNTSLAGFHPTIDSTPLVNNGSSFNFVHPPTTHFNDYTNMGGGMSLSGSMTATPHATAGLNTMGAPMTVTNNMNSMTSPWNALSLDFFGIPPPCPPAPQPPAVHISPPSMTAVPTAMHTHTHTHATAAHMGMTNMAGMTGVMGGGMTDMTGMSGMSNMGGMGITTPNSSMLGQTTPTQHVLMKQHGSIQGNQQQNGNINNSVEVKDSNGVIISGKNNDENKDNNNNNNNSNNNNQIKTKNSLAETYGAAPYYPPSTAASTNLNENKTVPSIATTKISKKFGGLIFVLFVFWNSFFFFLIWGFLFFLFFSLQIGRTGCNSVNTTHNMIGNNQETKSVASIHSLGSRISSDATGLLDFSKLRLCCLPVCVYVCVVETATNTYEIKSKITQKKNK